MNERGLKICEQIRREITAIGLPPSPREQRSESNHSRLGSMKDYEVRRLQDLPDEVKTDPAYVAFYKSKEAGSKWKKRKAEWKREKGWKKPPKRKPKVKTYFVDPKTL